MLEKGFVKKSVGTLTLGEKLAKIRKDKRLSLNEVSPRAKVVCWIFIFSYRRADSSFLLINWVPKISLSARISSYSSFLCCLSVSSCLILEWSLEISLEKFLMTSLLASIYFFFFSSYRLCSSRVWSFFLCSKCSLARATSLASIYSLSWLIWWLTILYLLLISAISSSV